MSFYMRDYTSDEKFDLSKFLDYEEGVFNVLSSPFLAGLKELPTVRYYYVNNGYKDVDLIASSVYGDPFCAYLIQFYNDNFLDNYPEDTVLSLFSLDDLNDLYHSLYSKQNLEGND